ncbi:outer membrane beta-barrel protein [Eikenella corrodens]|uniref:Autotransporter domain-containing protein n=1 Tax=Eikenella corrodens TaxID=539 RepID=A0A3S9SMB9_EIKCO|nr:autotransporter domain-containing protein [Eikenella corrodens]AZR60660.1 autotransporter domain-containing protein [Eikenella corrodens]
MQKTLLALSILSFAAAASAAPDSQETPLHPIKDGRYTVTTGYEHLNSKVNVIKQSSDGFVLRGRADIPLAQQHAIRAELTYSRRSSDMKENGVTTVDGGKSDGIDLYAGYLYSPSGFKQGGLRVGGGLGYGYTDSNARAHRTVHAPNAVDHNSSSLYLKAQVEYEQDLGGGWSITPWGEATVSVRRREETKWSQAFAVPDETHKNSSYGLGLGVDVQKQFTPNLALTFGPYYQYEHYKTHARDHVGGHIDSSTSHGHNFGIRAGLRF